MKTLIGVLMLAFAALSASGQSALRDQDPLVVVRNGLYGYIDHRGAMIIEPQFLWADDFQNGYGTVYLCGRYALIDKTRNIHPIDSPRPGSRLFPKKMDHKYGFVDAHGEWQIKPQFEEILPFSDGLAAVRVGDRWGFIDSSGAFAITPRFDAAYYFREGIGTAQIHDTTLLIDKSGKELARGYEVLSGIASEGRIPVSRGNRYGYLDLSGGVAIALTFDGAGTFSDGLAPVRRGSKWGYIDKSGAVVIPFKFDSAAEFGTGLAPVKMGSETGFIDHSGSFVFHLAFEYAPGFWGADQTSDVSRFWTKSQEFGYVTSGGRVIWGPTAGSPDHAPLLGWTGDDKKKSCEVVSDAVRRAALALPPGND